MKPGDSGVEAAQRLVVQRPQDGNPDAKLLEPQVSATRRREESLGSGSVSKAAEDVEAFEREKFLESEGRCHFACGGFNQSVERQ